MSWAEKVPDLSLNEEWRTIPGYEDFYEVSSTGKVRRCRTTNGGMAGTFLKQGIYLGYPQVRLSLAHKSKLHFVHRLVAVAFQGEMPSHDVHHIDHNRANNRLENLSYIPSRQHRRAARLGKGRPRMRGQPIRCEVLPANEEWRPVPGYETLYEVSSKANFRRLTDSKRYKAGYVITPQISNDGYRLVQLTRNHHAIAYKAARLTAAAFIGERPMGWHINHIDGCKNNDNLANLEYVTPSDNVRHAVKLGLTRRYATSGTNNPNAKLTPEAVKSILESEETAPALAKRFAVTPSAIRAVRAGRTWKYIERLRKDAPC